MKSWHKWMVPLVIACTVQVGLAGAAEKAAAKVTMDKQIAADLAAVLADLEAGLLTTDARTQRIAQLVASLHQIDPLHSIDILADFSRRVPTDSLSSLSAAAVMSAGARSPAVLEAIVEAQGDDSSRTVAVHTGALNPTQILGTRTAAQMRPTELQPASVPQPTPVIAATSSRIEADIRSVSSVEALPPPPQPPGIPPRPPALPYRGQ